MELKDFLQKLLDFGCNSEYFNIKPIGQLNKSCCPNSKTEVIDFDATKDKLCKEKGFQTFKSCDALKILPKSERLDFIELKGFKQFVKRLKSDLSSSEQIDKQIEKFDLANKVFDSNHIMYSLIHDKYYNLEKCDKVYYQTVKKSYIILVDIELEENGIENIALTLEFLGEDSTPIEKQILSKLTTTIITKDIISSIKNFNQPILKSCKTIDDFYAL